MVVDPRRSEAQLFGQLIEQVSKQSSVFIFTFHDKRRVASQNRLIWFTVKITVISDRG